MGEGLWSIVVGFLVSFVVPSILDISGFGVRRRILPASQTRYARFARCRLEVCKGDSSGLRFVTS